ncbi:hypothetical protein KAU55_06990, partial [Candidatus Bathyarchaeota archaeon]|nr:hypothetical protein [Candidatus Bathyarchaeota archaeon]
MNKWRKCSIFLLLMLISMTYKTVSTNAQSTEMSVINPETGNNNFVNYTSKATVGSRFNSTVWVHDVTYLFAYQAYLSVNDTLLNITNAWFPTWDSDWVFNGKATIRPAPAFYDLDTDGYMESVKIGDTILVGETFTGDGLLAIIEFERIYAPTSGSVFCNLDIDNEDTYLLNYELAEMPTEKTSGSYEYLSLPHGTSAISIIADPASVFFGENVSITGSIVPSKPDVTVAIQYRNVTGEPWRTLTEVQTDTGSQYDYTWETDEAGTVELKALWDGDNVTSGAESL